MLAKLVEDGQQPVEGEALQPHVADAGELGVGDAGAGGGLAGGRALQVEHLDDLGGEQGLRVPHLGIGIAEIAEDVPAAVDQLEIGVIHRNASFNRLSRSAIRPISDLGVAMPRLAFLWNAWTTQTSSPTFSA